MSTDNLTPAMLRALEIAKRYGAVQAGKGAIGGHVVRVSGSTIAALIRRGLLVHCYGGDGNMAGRLP